MDEFTATFGAFHPGDTHPALLTDIFDHVPSPFFYVEANPLAPELSPWQELLDRLGTSEP